MRLRYIRHAVALLSLLVLVALSCLHSSHVHAQTATTPLAITVAGLHTSCLPVAVGVTTFCFASDGLWQSLNGAAYVQLGVSIIPPVTSVNGKTGAVVLGAVTTSTTTLQ